ncbi:MAG: SUMF1/EgtB/PvdO family nonheme iron enzyme [Anaerolineales bacterium]|jgi:formylglycine-generating enzyme required for sulfatase activity
MMKTRFLSLLLGCLLLSACSSHEPPATPPPVVDTGVDSQAWVVIPSGPFLMGRHADEVEVDDDYRIMVTDVTVEQYAEYLNAAYAAGVIEVEGDEVRGYYPGDEFHEHVHEERIEAGQWLHMPLEAEGQHIQFDGEVFSAEQGFENHPITVVTWFGAQAYCQFYEWRLPSEVEWEKAARGTDGRAYPWGDQIDVQYANFYHSHDPYEVGYRTTPVGFYNGGQYLGFMTTNAASPYGLFDMAGNVWQWVGNVYQGMHYRIMRGGSQADYNYDLRVWTRNNAHPAYYSISVGFRCADDME